jgi:predicted MPP superfamily phosphohydrolase
MKAFRYLVLLIFSAGYFYLGHQLTRTTDLSFGTSLGIWIFISVLFAVVLAMPLYFWSDRRQRHQPWHDAFFTAAHLSLAYINFALVFVVLRDLAALVSPYHYYSADASILLLILPIVCIALGTAVVRVGPRLKQNTLHFLKLPKDLENLRLLHITDLHIGQSLPLEFVERLVTRAKKVPDIDFVLYTGDILDGLSERHQKELALLKEIPSKYGNYYVPGNHEYYWGGERAIEAFRDLGFHVLQNQTETLRIGQSSLQISGVPDPAAAMIQKPGPDIDFLKGTLQENSFKLLLAHQPNLAPAAAAAGFDLQLSGHTHGGQFFPWNFLIGLFQKYAKGLYHIQGMKLYVNQGTGYWGPSLRLGTYCELGLIVLKTLK